MNVKKMKQIIAAAFEREKKAELEKSAHQLKIDIRQFETSAGTAATSKLK